MFRFSVSLAVLLLTECLLNLASATRSFHEAFEYKGKHADPAHWGQFNKEWKMCKSGHLQSPIKLIDSEMVNKKVVYLGRDFKPGRATVTNRGWDIMVHWEEPSGGFYVNGTKFFLRQLHWHKPSEHVVNGQRFDVEMHMVHMSLDNRFAVLTGLYKLGEPDPFLEQMKSYVDAVKGVKNQKVEAGIIDPNDTDLDETEYYRYIGSLTTPPCSQGVVWTVSKKVKSVSREQIHRLMSATPHIHYNARPIQMTEKRVVDFYHLI